MADNETIRWPTNLDRKAIEQRLAKVAEKAAGIGLADMHSRFASAATMTAAQIATSVVTSLTWLVDLPEQERAAYEPIIKELEMVALNLKNLR